MGAERSKGQNTIGVAIDALV